MFYKLSCGCVVLIESEEYAQGSTPVLVKVVARTVERCSEEEDDYYWFARPTVYERQYNDQAGLPPEHEEWHKIEGGRQLSPNEHEVIYSKMNQLFADGRAFQGIRRFLGIKD